MHRATYKRKFGHSWGSNAVPFLAWTWVPHLKCKSIYNRCHDVSDKGCSLSLYLHTWWQCVWKITFSSWWHVSRMCACLCCVYTFAFLRFCTCDEKLEFRTEVPPHYDLSCGHTLASISCNHFLTNRSTECTGPHKRESLDTAEVAMRCHFWAELEFHISNANRSTTGATTWLIPCLRLRTRIYTCFTLAHEPNWHL